MKKTLLSLLFALTVSEAEPFDKITNVEQYHDAVMGDAVVFFYDSQSRIAEEISRILAEKGFYEHPNAYQVDLTFGRLDHEQRRMMWPPHPATVEHWENGVWKKAVYGHPENCEEIFSEMLKP